MKIHIPSFCYRLTSFVEANILSSLSAQHKKILGITLAIFGILTVVFLISRCYTKRQGTFLNKQVSVDGKIEEGNFKNGLLHGHGRKTSVKGTVSEGEFKDGKLCGSGKKIYPYLVKEGLVDDDISKNATGRRIETVEEGQFIESKLSGQGKRKFMQNLIVEDGEFFEGELHGKGRMMLFDGTIWQTGEFAKGKLHGQGMRIYPNGIKCEGEFTEGKLNGPTKITDSKGLSWQANFVDGKTNDQFQIIAPK